MPEAILAASALTRRFGGLVAVDEVSIELRCGQIHALIGTNGAGKSTLIDLLAGELSPTSGAIFLRGEPVIHGRPDRLARLGVGRTFQRSNVFSEFSAFEYCRIAAQARVPRVWALHEPAARCRASCDSATRVLAAVGLTARSDIAAGLLSHGERRELEIAMCLAADPSVLLLDEPLAGMGAEESMRVLELLRRIKLERAILLVEHDMDAVFAVADVITVTADGAVLLRRPMTFAAIPPARSLSGDAIEDPEATEATEAMQALIDARRVHTMQLEPRAARHRFQVGAGRNDRASRPQRHGQDDAAALAARPRETATRRDPRAGRRHDGRAPRADRAAGRRVRPRGARHLSESDRARKPRHGGARRRERRARVDARAGARALPEAG